jgi:hypothetical protein
MLNFWKKLNLSEQKKGTLIIIGKVLLLWGFITMITLFAFGYWRLRAENAN